MLASDTSVKVCGGVCACVQCKLASFAPRNLLLQSLILQREELVRSPRMHLTAAAPCSLLASTRAFTPAVVGCTQHRAREPSGGRRTHRIQRRATTTAKATGEHQIKAGDHVRLHYTLTTTSGQALDGAELTFDTEEVDLVVGAGGFLPALHNALTAPHSQSTSRRR